LKVSATNKLYAKRGAIILAGGDSKRLGQPKALLDLGGKTIIEMVIDTLNDWFDQMTLVTDKPELYEGLPVIITDDLIKERVKSPLRGIHAGLSVSDLSYQFVVACDMPFVNLELIKYMDKFAPAYDAVVPKIGNYYQPLHAFYSRSCISFIEEEIAAGSYKVIDFYAKLNIYYLNKEEIESIDPDQKSFININTWPDYDEALRINSSTIN
jgi:molybdenum cofactor guanylyltransferase